MYFEKITLKYSQFCNAAAVNLANFWSQMVQKLSKLDGRLFQKRFWEKLILTTFPIRKSYLDTEKYYVFPF